MRILALDSSGLVASVAIVEEEQVLAEYSVNYKKTHSQTLLPMLDEIVQMTEQDLGEIDAIAIAGGPGSFTGLRIGSATAKGLGLAIAVSELADKVNEKQQPVVFLGDGVLVYREILDQQLKVPHTYAPAHLSRQRAAAVGALGIQYYKEGRTETAMEHKPDYLRLSQAERERMERLKKEKEQA